MKHTKLIVTPSDWMNGGAESLLKPWVISYYFYDPLHPKGKQIRVKGMNFATTLTERRLATKQLIEHELKLLSSGYNPITKTRTVRPDLSLSEDTPFIQALKIANDSIVCEHQVRLDIRSVVKRIERHATEADMLLTPVSAIRRRDVVKLLDMCVSVDRISPNRYNVTKRYLSILYRYLSSREAVEYNFIKDIDSARQTKNIRTVITKAERERLYVLEWMNYPFFRFIQIFFASGSRVTEILKVQARDVNLSKQEYKITIKKGSYSKEEMKPISDNALKYWAELMATASPDQFILSEGLVPGATSIRRDQITRRWRTWCKEGLGIKADMYTLKHAHLDDIARTIGMDSARDLAGHTDAKTTLIYTHQEKQRRLEELKGLKLDL